MDLQNLIQQFSDTPENQEKAIFHSLFIAANQLQTIFDSRIPELSLKQFMLLAIIRHGKTPLSFSHLGKLLGCSRQNIKKLAVILEQKGFVSIKPSPWDTRAFYVSPLPKTESYFKNDFFKYQKELRLLFEVYTEKELGEFFRLFMKLHEGILRLHEEVED